MLPLLISQYATRKYLSLATYFVEILITQFEIVPNVFYKASSPHPLPLKSSNYHIPGWFTHQTSRPDVHNRMTQSCSSTYLRCWVSHQANFRFNIRIFTPVPVLSLDSDTYNTPSPKLRICRLKKLFPTQEGMFRHS